MVGWFREAEHVGFYSAAQKPIALLYILPSLIVGGFFPALARLAKKDEEKFRQIFERALTMITTIAFPVAFGIILTAEQFSPSTQTGGRSKSSGWIILVKT